MKYAFKNKRIVFSAVLAVMLLTVCLFVSACSGGGGDIGGGSSTNVQVEGIDESDIVKVTSDGYIFKVQIDGVTVSKAENGQVRVVKKAAISKFVPKEMYVNNGYLIVIGCFDADYDVFSTAVKKYTNTEIRYYDLQKLNDGTELIEHERRTSIEGDYLTSRIVDDKLIVVTLPKLAESNKYGYLDSVEGVVSKNAEAITEDSNAPFFMAKLNLSSLKSAYQAAAFTGDIEDIYCSPYALFAILRETSRNSKSRGCYGDRIERYTVAAKISFDDLKLSSKTDRINGSISNRYNLHDNGDYFFIVSHDGYNSVLTSFDKSMVKISEVKFAPGEQQFAVRYDGNYCYVVTFKQVDPLFKINISDPSQLQILGDLTIDGYSTFLQKFGANRMIGVGYDSDPRFEETFPQVKISLFDVINDNPKEINSLLFSNKSTAEAAYNPKAILCEPNNNIFAFAAEENVGARRKQGAYVYGITDGSLEERAFLSNFGITESYDGQRFGHLRKKATRLVRYGEYLYLISDGYITSYDLNGFDYIGTFDTRIDTYEFTVTLELNDGGEPVEFIAEGYDILDLPEQDILSGDKNYLFDGWYTDAALTKAFDVSKKVKSSLTLYAKWIKPSTDGLQLRFQDDGYVIYGTTYFTEKTVNIAPNYNGFPITSIESGAFRYSHVERIFIPACIKAIGSQAFADSKLKSIIFEEGSTLQRILPYTFNNCQSLTAVNIPASVEEIGYSAFSNCTSLKSITIPDSVKTIGYSAFNNCESLISIIIPEGVTDIYYSTFYNCKNLVSVTIPASVTKIEQDAFYNCESLESVVIPEGVTTVQPNTFYNCKNLSSVVIPDSVTAIGQAAFYNCESLVSVVIPKNIINIGSSAFSYCVRLKAVAIPDKVTYIGDDAFSYCLRLESVTIPDSVTYIGYSTFRKCVRLKEIVIPFGVTRISDSTFADCEELTSIILPERLVQIGAQAFKSCLSLTEIDIPLGIGRLSTGTFSNCISLKSVNLPNGITSIDSNAFSNCRSLTSMVLPKRLFTIGRSAFSNCESLISVVIPASVTSIGSNAFENCKSLTEITIPRLIQRIEQQTFYNCTSLKSVTLPEGLNHIGNSAFASSGLESITVPDSVSDIGQSAFSSCASLKTVTLPNGLIRIRSSAFSYCTSLKSVAIPDSVTSIGDGVFISCTSLQEVIFSCGIKLIPNNMFSNCTSLKTIAIPDNITQIGTEAFADCSALESVILPDTLSRIGNAAFKNCIKLTAIIIPDGIEIIETGTFYGCTGLTSVTIPDSVTEIQSNAFYFCTSLTSITIPESVKEIGYYAFRGCTKLSVTLESQTPPKESYSFADAKAIYVPKSAVNDYKKAWEEYSKKIYKA